jgi:ribonuclease HI
MPIFIANFLSNRHFRVRVGNHLSDAYDQEMGVPQGSILSVTLFILKINSIVKCLPADVRSSLYVDDFLICYRSRYMPSIERKLQMCLNKIETWADENGFKFSKSKTVCMHFCQQYTLHLDPELVLYGDKRPVVEETKFLGLIFDKRLTFTAHIRHLKDRCLKALNLLRVVGRMDWGADSVTLMKLYHAQVRSKLDYGCVVYGSARSSYLQPLDRVQNAALRTCIGAFRTSPIASLHVEASELPLSLRRQKLALQYITKLKANPSNPAYSCVFAPCYKALFEARPAVIPTIGIRMQQQLSDAGINVGCVARSGVCAAPPWVLRTAVFVYTLHQLGSKSEVAADLFQSKFWEILASFVGYERIYTDASQDGPAVAAAAISRIGTRVKRLPNDASIFSGEARAILLALDMAEQAAGEKVLVMSDSLSCLQSIENRRFDNPLVLEILTRVHDFLSDGRRIAFMWLPSHMGLAGNVAVDAAAKAALTLRPAASTIPYSDLKPVINSYVCANWQKLWDTEVHNKLHAIEPRIGSAKFYRLPRRDEIIIHRLRIGHTRFTHSYLLKGESPPMCIGCNCVFTVQHILIDCVEFAWSRVKFFNVSSLRELFDTVQTRVLIDFIKDIGLYRKL